MKKRLLSSVAMLMAVAATVYAQTWAMPRLSVAHVRTGPAHSSEMSTQALMGMPLKVVGEAGRWVKVELPDGYQGYVRGNSLVMMTEEDMSRWRASHRVVVTSIDERKIYADTLRRDVVSDVVDGNILVYDGDNGRWTAVVLPDGRKGWIGSCDVTPVDRWAAQAPSSDTILEVARRQLGAPYTWGGNSSKGMDCSGLVKMAYLHCGLILRRDAHQQADEGVYVPAAGLSHADLVFYGDKSTGHIDHVAIYAGNDTVIESAGLVRYNTPACGSRYITSRRILGQGNVMSARCHPWYF